MKEIILQLSNHIASLAKPIDPAHLKQFFDENPLNEKEAPPEVIELHQLLLEYFKATSQLQSFAENEKALEELSSELSDLETQIAAITQKTMALREEIHSHYQPIKALVERELFAQFNEPIFNALQIKEIMALLQRLRSEDDILVQYNLLKNRSSEIHRALNEQNFSLPKQVTVENLSPLMALIESEISNLATLQQEIEQLQQQFAQQLSLSSSSEDSDEAEELSIEDEIASVTAALSASPLSSEIRGQLDNEFNTSDDKAALIKSYRDKIDNYYTSFFSFSAWTATHKNAQLEYTQSVDYLQLLVRQQQLYAEQEENKAIPLADDQRPDQEKALKQLAIDLLKRLPAENFVQFDETVSASELFDALLIGLSQVSDVLDAKRLTSSTLTQLLAVLSEMEQLHSTHSSLTSDSEHGSHSKELVALKQLCDGYEQLIQMDAFSDEMIGKYNKIKKAKEQILTQGQIINAIKMQLIELTTTIATKIDTLTQDTLLEANSSVSSPKLTRPIEKFAYDDEDKFSTPENLTSSEETVADEILLSEEESYWPNAHTESVAMSDNASQTAGDTITVVSPQEEIAPMESLSPRVNTRANADQSIPSLIETPQPAAETVYAEDEKLSSEIPDINQQAESLSADIPVPVATTTTLAEPPVPPSPVIIAEEPLIDVVTTAWDSQELADKTLSATGENEAFHVKKSTATQALEPEPQLTQTVMTSSSYKTVPIPTVSQESKDYESTESSEDSHSSSELEQSSSQSSESSEEETPVLINREQLKKEHKSKLITISQDNISRWDQKNKTYVMQHSVEIQNWYANLSQKIMNTQFDEVLNHKASHLMRDILFEFENKNDMSIIMAYMQLCPNPATEIQVLLGLKPSLLIPNEPYNEADELMDCPLELKPHYEHYFKLKSKHPVEAELFLQAIRSVHALVQYSNLPTCKITKEQIPALLIDPRYEPLKKHRGFLKVWEFLEDLYRFIVAKITGKAESDYAKKPYFFPTQSAKLIEKADLMAQNLLSTNSV